MASTAIEDDARLPGIGEAIQRDMQMAMTLKVRRPGRVQAATTGANEDTADVVGMQTAAITETTMTQANKIKADEVLKFFLEYVDGKYAASLSDVRIVTSVGANVLWHGVHPQRGG